jgi:hypothetical protein
MKIVSDKYKHILSDDDVVYFLQEYLHRPLELKYSQKGDKRSVDEIAYVFTMDDFLYNYLFKRLYEQREYRRLDGVELSLCWSDIVEDIKKSGAYELFIRMCEEATRRYAMAKDVEYVVSRLENSGNTGNGNVIIIKSERKAE